MAAPKHSRDTDKGRYYGDPQGGPQLISVTNVLDTAVAKPVLTKWAAKVVAEYAMDSLPTLVKMSRRDRDAATRMLKERVSFVRETAANLGTRVHDWAEAHVLGRPHPDDPEIEPYALQLIEFFRAWGVDFERDVEATEATVLHRKLGYAGTLDLLVWLTINSRRVLCLVDYKTSATRASTSVYPEYGLQLAGLRHAETLLLPDDSEVPVPKVAQAFVLNLRQRRHALIPMRAGRDEFAAFRSALATARYLHGYDDKPEPLAAPQSSQEVA